MKVEKVANLQAIDLTRYNDGDMFLTKHSIGFIHNNKMETLVKQSDVRKIVREEVKKVLKEHDK